MYIFFSSYCLIRPRFLLSSFSSSLFLVVAGSSSENEGSKKVNKKNKKKGNLRGFKLRFNSKRLGRLGKQLSPEKQRIIRNGPFGHLLDI